MPSADDWQTDLKSQISIMESWSGFGRAVVGDSAVVSAGCGSENRSGQAMGSGRMYNGPISRQVF